MILIISVAAFCHSCCSSAKKVSWSSVLDHFIWRSWWYAADRWWALSVLDSALTLTYLRNKLQLPPQLPLKVVALSGNYCSSSLLDIFVVLQDQQGLMQWCIFCDLRFFISSYPTIDFCSATLTYMHDIMLWSLVTDRHTYRQTQQIEIQTDTQRAIFLLIASLYALHHDENEIEYHHFWMVQH